MREVKGDLREAFLFYFIINYQFKTSELKNVEKLLEQTLGGVVGISSDRDDRRIFLGLKFSIRGFFWVRKFGKYFFG